MGKKQMIAVPITELNREAYLSQVPVRVQSLADLIVGVETENRRACGVMAWEAYDDMMLLSYVFVEASYRRQGAMASMMELSEAYAKENGIRMMAVSYEAGEDLLPFGEALVALGFVDLAMEEKGRMFCAPLGAILQQIPKVTLKEQILPFGDIPTRLFVELQNSMKHLLDCDGVDTVPIIRDKGDYDPALSVVALDYEHKVAGCVLSTITGDNEIYIEYVYVQGNHPKRLSAMLQQVAAAARERFSEQTMVRMQIQNAASESLISKLAGGKEEETGQVVTRYRIL